MNKKDFLQVTSQPIIEIEEMRKVGLYGVGVGIAVINSGYDEQYCGEIEDWSNFTESLKELLF